MVRKFNPGDDDHESPHFEDTTMKFPAVSLDSAKMAALRASLPPLPPIHSRALNGPPAAAERHDTPHTIVLPSVPPPDRATLTVLAGPDPGASFTIEHAETVLGRSRQANIPIDELSISRLHARITRKADGRYLLEDLESRNGTFVGARRVTRCYLRSGDRVQIGRACVLRFAMVDEVEDELQRRLYETASRDELTGLANRRRLFESMALEIARCEGGGMDWDVALLMIDIDHFKRVNDTFGHLAGDQVLRAMGMAGEQVIRSGDLLARFGGEELSALLPGAGKEEACTIAERLRQHLAAVRVEVGGGSVTVTVSIGLAVLSECGPHNDDHVRALVGLADERLYQAKMAGRNNVKSGA
jgi:diguanylate cyclase (GGDEF)-like protein